MIQLARVTDVLLLYHHIAETIDNYHFWFKLTVSVYSTFITLFIVIFITCLLIILESRIFLGYNSKLNKAILRQLPPFLDLI